MVNKIPIDINYSLVKKNFVYFSFKICSFIHLLKAFSIALNAHNHPFYQFSKNLEVLKSVSHISTCGPAPSICIKLTKLVPDHFRSD